MSGRRSRLFELKDGQTGKNGSNWMEKTREEDKSEESIEANTIMREFFELTEDFGDVGKEGRRDQMIVSY